MSIAHPEVHSATVSMRLTVGDNSYGVAQVAGKTLVLRDECHIAEPVNGQLFIVVDGEEFVYDVFFFAGIDSNKKEVAFF